ncbi:MAG: hypothetical protein L3J93_05465 [Thermoplasmata archaeon]|nr:hypothetical protein [Thermoplasmata archaeon]
MTPERRAAPTATVGVEACARPGCAEAIVRHLSLPEARKAFPDLADGLRSVALCRLHYKEWKKRTKESRKLDRLGW